MLVAALLAAVVKLSLKLMVVDPRESVDAGTVQVVVTADELGHLLGRVVLRALTSCKVELGKLPHGVHLAARWHRWHSCLEGARSS